MNEDFRMEQGYKEAAYGDSLWQIYSKDIWLDVYRSPYYICSNWNVYDRWSVLCKPGTRQVLKR